MEHSDNPAQPNCLLGLSVELAGRQFLVGPGLTLGRSASADVFLPDPAVGRRHCRIEVDPAGGLSLVSLESSPRVLLNGSPALSSPLRLDDELAIGRFRLRIARVNAADSTVDSAADASWEIDRFKVESGAVLSARLTVDELSALPGFAERLLARAQILFTHGAGILVTNDPACLRIAWPALPRETWAETATKAALVLHCLAFAESGRLATGRLAIGLSYGPFIAGSSQAQQCLWGPAADQALRLALEGPAFATCIDPADVGRVDGLTWSIAADDTANWRIVGLRANDRGRRLKLLTATPLRLARAGCMERGLLLRVSHDPQNDDVSAVVLCKAPLELGAKYLMSAAAGLPIALDCRSCQPMRSGSVLRAQFAGRIARPTLARFLQCRFDPDMPSINIRQPFAA